tara:strand:+ start:1051 stop:1797 length:747 start_codon:yes stop_codon:yes gene_type:complete
MNFKLVTSLNKRLYEHRAQQILNSALNLGYETIVYHEDSYEGTKIDFPKNAKLKTIDLWELPEYHFWIKNFIDSPETPWNNQKYLSLHPGSVYKKTQGKYWFRKVLAITHAVLNADKDYIIWVDGDAKFEKPLDDKFWDFTKKFDVSCIWRDYPHIETGFVVYKISEDVKRAMREYLGWFATGEIWKTPRYCDCSALTHVVKNHPQVSVGKYKNFEWNGLHSSEFDISEYFNHNKVDFKEVRDIRGPQ